KRRIETYINLLKVKLNEGTDDLEKLEGRLRDCADGFSALKKSHSSPSLNLELQTPIVKVKRNVSERRTYRKILPSRRRKAL
ncbi:hypothetical protein chiPu_0025952, partial [Chiloscyllium punctatum]|nr:hypothetical protein [Chiloscyllium punctatum]